jgi:hypothetical protein
VSLEEKASAAQRPSPHTPAYVSVRQRTSASSASAAQRDSSRHEDALRLELAKARCSVACLLQQLQDASLLLELQQSDSSSVLVSRGLGDVGTVGVGQVCVCVCARARVCVCVCVCVCVRVSQVCQVLVSMAIVHA